MLVCAECGAAWQMTEARCSHCGCTNWIAPERRAARREPAAGISLGSHPAIGPLPLAWAVVAALVPLAGVIVAFIRAEKRPPDLGRLTVVCVANVLWMCLLLFVAYAALLASMGPTGD